MEVNDVRVGNYVYGGAQMKVYQVMNVHIADLITIQNGEEDLECLSDRVYPIELTDKLLEQIGYVRYDKHSFRHPVYGDIFKVNDSYYPYNTYGNFVIGNRIQGLHHLQNIVYALTGEEIRLEDYEHILR